VQTIHVVKKTDADGSLALRIPLGKPGTEYEVLIVIEPSPNQDRNSEDRGWPSGYFNNTYGSIDDETFRRPAQGSAPGPVEMD
jgi:hypothetical protein